MTKESELWKFLSKKQEDVDNVEKVVEFGNSSDKSAAL